MKFSGGGGGERQEKKKTFAEKPNKITENSPTRTVPSEGPRILGTQDRARGPRSARNQRCDKPRRFADKPKTGVCAGGRISETGPVGFVETRGK